MNDIPDKVLLAGASWASGTPHLVLDAVAPDPPRRMRVPVAGWTGTLTRLQRKLCVGRYRLGTGGSEPCPDRASVADEFTECWACRTASGFNPAFDRVDPSTLSPQQRRYNARPHAVYLAHFGGDVVKVGISSVGRLPTRLAEQGARAAVRLTELKSAWDARAVEVAVHDQGFPEVVHDATKRRLLATPFPRAEALERLRGDAARMRQRLALSSPEVEVVPLTYLGGARLRRPLIDLTDERPFRVGGRALGLVGKVLVVEQRGLHFAASLTRAIGHVVALDPEPRRNPMPPGAGQLSLLG